MLKTKVPRTETHAIEACTVDSAMYKDTKENWGLEMQLTVEGAHLGPLGT